MLRDLNNKQITSENSNEQCFHVALETGSEKPEPGLVEVNPSCSLIPGPGNDSLPQQDTFGSGSESVSGSGPGTGSGSASLSIEVPDPNDAFFKAVDEIIQSIGFRSSSTDAATGSVPGKVTNENGANENPVNENGLSELAANQNGPSLNLANGNDAIDYSKSCNHEDVKNDDDVSLLHSKDDSSAETASQQCVADGDVMENQLQTGVTGFDGFADHVKSCNESDAINNDENTCSGQFTETVTTRNDGVNNKVDAVLQHKNDTLEELIHAEKLKDPVLAAPEYLTDDHSIEEHVDLERNNETVELSNYNGIQSMLNEEQPEQDAKAITVGLEALVPLCNGDGQHPNSESPPLPLQELATASVPEKEYSISPQESLVTSKMSSSDQEPTPTSAINGDDIRKRPNELGLADDVSTALPNEMVSAINGDETSKGSIDLVSVDSSFLKRELGAPLRDVTNIPNSAEATSSILEVAKATLLPTPVSSTSEGQMNGKDLVSVDHQNHMVNGHVAESGIQSKAALEETVTWGSGAIGNETLESLAPTSANHNLSSSESHGDQLTNGIARSDNRLTIDPNPDDRCTPDSLDRISDEEYIPEPKLFKPLYDDDRRFDESLPDLSVKNEAANVNIQENNVTIGPLDSNGHQVSHVENVKEPASTIGKPQELRLNNDSQGITETVVGAIESSASLAPPSEDSANQNHSSISHDDLLTNGINRSDKQSKIYPDSNPDDRCTPDSLDRFNDEEYVPEPKAFKPLYDDEVRKIEELSYVVDDKETLPDWPLKNEAANENNQEDHVSIDSMDNSPRVPDGGNVNQSAASTTEKPKDLRLNDDNQDITESADVTTNQCTIKNDEFLLTENTSPTDKEAYETPPIGAQEELQQPQKLKDDTTPCSKFSQEHRQKSEDHWTTPENNQNTTQNDKLIVNGISSPTKWVPPVSIGNGSGTAGGGGSGGDLPSIFIRGGTVVNEDLTTCADVYIEKGKISYIGDIDAEKIPAGVQVVDAMGKYILPGCIDFVTVPSGGRCSLVSSEDFSKRSKTALSRGVTLIVETIVPTSGESLLESYSKWRQLADNHVFCNYALTIRIHSWSQRVKADMTQLSKKYGILAFSFLLASSADYSPLSDSDLFQALQHCKDIQVLVIAQLPETRDGHCETSAEVVQLNRFLCIALLVKCTVAVLPVESRNGAIIRRFRRKGLSILIGSSAGYMTSPSQSETVFDPKGEIDRRALEAALRIENRSFDGNSATRQMAQFHCCNASLLEKPDEPACSRLSSLFPQAADVTCLDIPQLVAVTSSALAKAFNLYPQKGRLDIGSDADLVVWNPSATNSPSTAKTDKLLSYLHRTTSGGISVTILAGKIVAQNGKVIVKKKLGEVVPTFPSPILRDLFEKMPTVSPKDAILSAVKLKIKPTSAQDNHCHCHRVNASEPLSLSTPRKCSAAAVDEQRCNNSSAPFFGLRKRSLF